MDGSRSFIGNTLRKDFDDNIKHKKDNVLCMRDVKTILKLLFEEDHSDKNIN